MQDIFLGGQTVPGFAIGTPDEACGIGDLFDTFVDVVTAPVKAVASAGKAIYNTADDAAEAIGNAVGSIPVLGDVTRIVGDAATAPARLASDIASGARLDRALLRAAKDQVRIAREAAPYAQTVISVVPGIGSGVSAAVGAGIALSEGKGIDEAAKAAVRDALPGGPAAQVAFDAALAVAEGKRLDKAALEAARNQIPAGPGRQAFDVGLAVVTGENIQKALVDGFAKMTRAQLGNMGSDWVKAVVSKPEIIRALAAIPKDKAPGYAVAMGALSHEGINPDALIKLRNKLSGKAREGFDTALKAQKKKQPWLNNVLSPPPKETPRPRAPTPATAQAPAPAARRPPQLRTTAAPKPAAPAPAPRTPPQLRSGAAPVRRPTPAPAPTPAPTARPLTRAKEPSKALPAVPSPAETRATTYGPYPHPQEPGVSAPKGGGGGGWKGGKGGGGGGHHHGGHGGHRRGGRPVLVQARGWDWPVSWWNTPWIPETVTRTETCQMWGDPIEMPPPMQNAAKMALGMSKGRPTTVRGPDNVIYLFAYEGGAITARPCAATAVA